MRILALNSALARCSAALVDGERIVAARQQDGPRRPAALLAVMAEQVLAEAGLRAADLDLVAVTVGPGGFTGIRVALALAHGIGLAAGRPVVGVTVGEALAESLPHLGHRRLWTAIASRSGRVFLERAEEAATIALDALPDPAGPIAVAGDAAVEVAARLAARGQDVMLTDARLPQPRSLARAGRRRLGGDLPPRAAQPVYVDPPEARLPATPRPPPDG